MCQLGSSATVRPIAACDLFRVFTEILRLSEIESDGEQFIYERVTVLPMGGDLICLSVARVRFAFLGNSESRFEVQLSHNRESA